MQLRHNLRIAYIIIRNKSSLGWEEQLRSVLNFSSFSINVPAVSRLKFKKQINDTSPLCFQRGGESEYTQYSTSTYAKIYYWVAFSHLRTFISRHIWSSPGLQNKTKRANVVNKRGFQKPILMFEIFHLSTANHLAPVSYPWLSDSLVYCTLVPLFLVQ